jgi:cytochrome c oxidase cbb3-type subunit 3
MSELDRDLDVDVRPEDGPVVHEYDGIQECDNKLPVWWLWTFYGAIIFALGYWMHYHTLKTGDTPAVAYEKVKEAELAAEAARIKAAGEVNAEMLITLSKDKGTVAQGKKTFDETCVTCHAAGGIGKIGPNLTDEYWLHGGDPVSIYKTVRDGFLQKQMPAWGKMLGEERVRAATAYVLTLRNTNAPGGKAPQGVVMK